MTFRSPKVGPATEEERQKRQQLEMEMHGTGFSGAIGWIIKQGTTIGKEALDVVVTDLLKLPAFQNEPRMCIGWSLLLHFTFKVRFVFHHFSLQNGSYYWYWALIKTQTRADRKSTGSSCDSTVKGSEKSQ